LRKFQFKNFAFGPKLRLIESGYYSSLAPFRTLFETGQPILTYHKLGPRPSGARLKGLYLSEKLFRHQLTELRREEWQSGSLDMLSAEKASPESGRKIVITFDDGFRNVLEHALDPLRENQFTAIQFIVAGRIGLQNEWDLANGERPEPLMDTGEIREWLAAGHEIGSHSLTHPFLTRLAVAEAREEICASKKRLEDLFGKPVRDFCYPYGDWNETVRDVVSEAGYQTACTTEFGVNRSGESPLTLKRLTARYPSRNWKNFKQLCRGWLFGSSKP